MPVLLIINWWYLMEKKSSKDLNWENRLLHSAGKIGTHHWPAPLPSRLHAFHASTPSKSCWSSGVGGTRCHHCIRPLLGPAWSHCGCSLRHLPSWETEHMAVWVANREGSLELPWHTPPDTLPSHKDTQILANSRIFERSLYSGPVFMVYQKPENLN